MKMAKIKTYPPIFFPEIDISDLDAKTVFMLDLPGHRTAKGRSGLGYVASSTELAYMQGLMLRWLFTRKFLTHNPVYLLVMFVSGFMVGVVPLGAVLFKVIDYANYVIDYANYEIVFALILGSPYIAVGCALFVNSLLSPFNWNAKTITGD
jgi:hypothetical protein